MAPQAHGGRPPSPAVGSPPVKRPRIRAIRVSFPRLTGRKFLESREAYGPSVPLLERPGPALIDSRPPAASGPSDHRPNQRAPILGPSESQRARGPSLGCPASPASGHRPNQPDQRPGPTERSPPRRRVRPRPIPTQARASATGATCTGQGLSNGCDNPPATRHYSWDSRVWMTTRARLPIAA